MFYIKNKQVYSFPVPGFTRTIGAREWEALNSDPSKKIVWDGDIPRAVPKTDGEMKEVLIAQKQQYLRDTDWYAVRFAETGKEIPADVLAARQAARAEIDALREAEE